MQKKILVIDDHPEILELIAMLLEENEYKAEIHSERVHDLKIIKQIKPDLVIIDQMIGGDFSGWDFIQKMKLDRETAPIPIIVCTSAVKLVEEMKDQLTAKNVAVVLKPFDIEDLLRATSAALGKIRD